MKPLHRLLLFLMMFCIIGPASTLAQVAPDAKPFPFTDLLPKRETGALEFIQEYPEYDGRGVIVAIFDTGVDPAAPGLQVTTDGRPKMLDCIDATGSGDVITTMVQQAEDGVLTGLSERKLTIDPDWKNPSGDFRLGLKAAYELFPEELVARLQSKRKREWDRRQQQRAATLRDELAQWNDAHPSPTAEQKRHRRELQARIEVLKQAQGEYDDLGPIYDCVLFHDGEAWRAVVDTDGDGDLTNDKMLTDYDREPESAFFGDDSSLTFSVHIYDEGDTLSIVTACGAHGTHVAGIVGAHFPDDPARNGVAPGVRFVSVKIGDTRLEGMETGTGLLRGLRAVIDHQCDMINMSYGEPTSTPDRGRLIDAFNEVVNEHNVIYVASAGNEGPALSTVGAPGGTSSAAIGVGAYVSPAMAQSQYSQRLEGEHLPYTWTSRGPAADGDLGVNIFAPGGAITTVPLYLQQPSERMNGTSMASPNACGGIALLLSGLNANGVSYSPHSVRRAIENRAQVLEDTSPFAQGHGLLQVHDAYEHLIHHADAPGEQLRFDVTVNRRYGTRGLYLRESELVVQPVETFIRVQPQFPRSATTEQRQALEVAVDLVSTANWLDAGDHILLTHGGGGFEVRVEPQDLPGGAHFGEVLGLPADDHSRGPLFRVPVTVIKPDIVVSGETIEQQCELTAGGVCRRFLEIPAGTQWVDITLQSESAETSKLYVLHTVQLLEGETFEKHQQQQYVRLDADGRRTISVPVVAGRTLEVCVAQYWDSLGPSQLNWEMHLRGLEPEDDAITLSSTEQPVPLEVSAVVSRESFAPQGKFTTHRKLVAPDSAKIAALTSARDRLPDEAHAHRLLLEYRFNQPKEGRVTLLFPGLADMLYDSPLDGQLSMLYDWNKRLIRTDDMWPEPQTLAKGDYRLRVELRHSDPAKLEAWQDLLLAVDRPLSKSLPVNVHRSQAAAVAGSKGLPRVAMQPGDDIRCWLTGPELDELPKSATAGDVLLGTLALCDTSGLAGAEKRPEGYPIEFVVPSVSKPTATDDEDSSSDPSKPKAADLAKSWLDERVKQLGELKWPRDKALIESLEQSILKDRPKHRPALIAKLHLLDGDNRKEHLPLVVQAADAVIATLRPGRLATYFGRRHEEFANTQARQSHQQMTTQRSDLIDALYRKGRALAYRELPDVVDKHPIENQQQHDRAFEENFQQLANWVDTTEADYFLLHIRRDRRAGRYATAIKLLNQHADDEPPKWLYHKKRRDLYELLGWTDWQAYEQRRMLHWFPKAEQVF